MHICKYMCIFIYTYTYICVYKHKYMDIYKYIYTYMNVFIYIYAHAYILLFVCNIFCFVNNMSSFPVICTRCNTLKINTNMTASQSTEITRHITCRVNFEKQKLNCRKKFTRHVVRVVCMLKKHYSTYYISSKIFENTIFDKYIIQHKYITQHKYSIQHKYITQHKNIIQHKYIMQHKYSIQHKYILQHKYIIQHKNYRLAVSRIAYYVLSKIFDKYSLLQCVLQCVLQRVLHCVLQCVLYVE